MIARRTPTLFRALPLLAIIFVAPAAWGATIGYDFVFTCTLRDCSTTTTGTFEVDEAALAGATGGDVIALAAFQVDDDVYGSWTLTDALAPNRTALVGSLGELDGVFFSPSFVPLKNQIFLFETGDYSIRLPDGFTIAAGTYTFTRQDSAPVPEPGAAVLFSVGGLLVAHRCRRRPQHR